MKPILLYSGGCPVCRFGAHLISKLDGEIRILPFRDPLAYQLLWRSIPEEKHYKHWWVMVPEDGWYEGNDGGGIQLLKVLKRTRWIGLAAEKLRLNWLVDFIDDFINIHRPELAQVLPKTKELRRGI